MSAIERIAVTDRDVLSKELTTVLMFLVITERFATSSVTAC
jgi:hypothetical protein